MGFVKYLDLADANLNVACFRLRVLVLALDNHTYHLSPITTKRFFCLNEFFRSECINNKSSDTTSVSEVNQDRII